MTTFSIGAEFFPNPDYRPTNPRDIVRYRIDVRGLPTFPDLVVEEGDIEEMLCEPYSTTDGKTRWTYNDLARVIETIGRLRQDYGAHGHAEDLFQERDAEDRQVADRMEFLRDLIQGIAAVDALESALKGAYPRVVARIERGL